ncbi:MAG: TetR/AcrR family transcriptional regulator [Actinomycetota bacterium]
MSEKTPGHTGQDRRTVILDSAAALFAARGVAGTSVREIADAVGILSGSLYHHFVSKDEIVAEILRSYLEDLHGRYQRVLQERQDPRAAVESLIRVSLEIIRDHPSATQVYQNEAALISTLAGAEDIRQAGSDIARIWVDTLGRGILEGVFGKELDPKVVHRLMRDSIWLTGRWFRPSTEYTYEDLSGDTAIILLDGLARKGEDAGA